MSIIITGWSLRLISATALAVASAAVLVPIAASAAPTAVHDGWACSYEQVATACDSSVEPGDSGHHHHHRHHSGPAKEAGETITQGDLISG